jgi:hypothetical protein
MEQRQERFLRLMAAAPSVRSKKIIFWHLAKLETR